MIRIFFVIVLCLQLGGCLPAVFTVAASSAVGLAKDRSPGEAIDDLTIESKIKAILAKKSFRNLYTKISVNVVEGRVLYTGTVERDGDVITAVQTAWDQQGVKEVVNELTIDENSNKVDPFQYARDSLITAKIKSEMFVAKDIKFVNYTVVTVNDKVYLFGISRSDEELRTVANIAAKVKGVKRVLIRVRNKPESSEA